MYSNGVDGSKVPFYSSNLLFEYFVPEPRLEFALAERCGRHVHGFLPTSEQDVWSLGRDGCAVQWRLGDIRLELIERLGLEQFCRLVLATRNEIAPIWTHLDIRHNLSMSTLVRHDLVARLGLIEGNLSRLMSRDNLIRRRPKCQDGRLALDWVEHGQWLLGLLGAGAVAVDGEDTNGTLVTHTLLGDTCDQRVVVAECHTLDRGWKLPSEQALSRLDFP